MIKENEKINQTTNNPCKPNEKLQAKVNLAPAVAKRSCRAVQTRELNTIESVKLGSTWLVSPAGLARLSGHSNIPFLVNLEKRFEGIRVGAGVRTGTCTSEIQFILKHPC